MMKIGTLRLEIVRSFISVLIPILVGFNIAADAQIPMDGMIGNYTFDGNTLDDSGMENHGTIVGNVSYSQGRTGVDNGAALLNGGYINLGNSVEFQSTESISICAWINPVQINDWQAIVTKWDDFGSGGYYLGINPDGNLVRWNIDVSNPIDGNTISTNKWTHVVATYDGDTSKLYIDGQLVNQEFHGSLIADNNANVFVGSQFNIPNEFTFIGSMDDLLIYNRALDQDEVLDIFNFLPTSISDVWSSAREISFYPIPAFSDLYFDSDSGYENVEYTIVDRFGKNIAKGTSESNRIDISNLNSGLYILLISVENKIFSEKIVIQ